MKKLSTKPTAGSTIKSPKPPKPNPFGSAKPREEVLAKKGIDFHVIDDRIQKKASVAHFSREQEINIQILQNDLTRAEETLREANESELPEETLRERVDEKRKAFNDLMNRYKEENEGKDVAQSSRFDRPYDRRSRTKQLNNRHYRSEYQKPKDDTNALGLDPFASFHTKSKSRGDQYHRMR